MDYLLKTKLFSFGCQDLLTNACNSLSSISAKILDVVISTESFFTKPTLKLLDELELLDIDELLEEELDDWLELEELDEELTLELLDEDDNEILLELELDELEKLLELDELLKLEDEELELDDTEDELEEL